MRVLEWIVEPAADAWTAERWLRRRGLSRHLIVLLKNAPDGLTLDGAPLRTIDRVHAGGRVRLALPETARTDHILPVPLPLQIIYEDTDLLVVDKAAGMAVHPSQGNRLNTLANALAARAAACAQPFVFRPIGRLDKNTSGLMVLAKNAFAACLLSAQPPTRTYLAICEGIPPVRGVIDAPIGRTQDSVIARCIRPDGDRAVTHYERLAHASDGGRALVRVHLETGRTHQIRVHFAHIGHPLTGDFLYGAELPGFDRHALHAAALALTHPVSGDTLRFSAPLPHALRALLE